jgi:hypothetical protein
MYIQHYQLELIIGSRNGLVKGKMQRGENKDIFSSFANTNSRSLETKIRQSIVARRDNSMLSMPSIGDGWSDFKKSPRLQAPF